MGIACQTSSLMKGRFGTLKTSMNILQAQIIPTYRQESCTGKWAITGFPDLKPQHVARAYILVSVFREVLRPYCTRPQTSGGCAFWGKNLNMLRREMLSLICLILGTRDQSGAMMTLGISEP